MSTDRLCEHGYEVYEGLGNGCLTCHQDAVDRYRQALELAKPTEEYIDALRSLMGRMRVHGDDLAVMLANDTGLPSIRRSIIAKWRDAVNETYELLPRNPREGVPNG